MALTDIGLSLIAAMSPRRKDGGEDLCSAVGYRNVPPMKCLGRFNPTQAATAFRFRINYSFR